MKLASSFHIILSDGTDIEEAVHHETEIFEGGFSHFDEGEEGFILVIDGGPIVTIDEQSCQAKLGDLFYFSKEQDHSVSGVGRVLTFHGAHKGVFQREV